MIVKESDDQKTSLGDFFIINDIIYQSLWNLKYNKEIKYIIYYKKIELFY